MYAQIARRANLPQAFWIAEMAKSTPSSLRLAPTWRGVTANRHETWARDAMDDEVSSARFFARTNDILRTTKSCGPGAPGLAPSLRAMNPKRR
jgi:hypothetical protein